MVYYSRARFINGNLYYVFLYFCEYTQVTKIIISLLFIIYVFYNYVLQFILMGRQPQPL